jgi:hypothetical protein
MQLVVCKDDLIEKVIGAAIEVHLAQIMDYQRLLGFKRGLLANFNCRLLKDGIKRVSI